MRSSGIQSEPGTCPRTPVSSSAFRTSTTRTFRPCFATKSALTNGTPLGVFLRFATQLMRNIRSSGGTEPMGGISESGIGSSLSGRSPVHRDGGPTTLGETTCGIHDLVFLDEHEVGSLGKGNERVRRG